jgi:hypothetical protein
VHTHTTYNAVQYRRTRTGKMLFNLIVSLGLLGLVAALSRDTRTYEVS